MAKKTNRYQAIPTKRIGSRNILFIPAVGNSQGIGHLKRCAELVRKAGGRAWLYLPGEKTLPKEFIPLLPQARIRKDLPQSRQVVVVIDDRETPLSSLLSLPKAAVVVGLDEGGKWRDCFPYLIDTLPLVRGKSAPNAVFPVAVPPPAKKQKPLSFPFKRVILSFGGEDRKNLSKKLLDMLLRHKIFTPAQISLVQGPLFPNTVWPPGIKIYKNVRDLAAVLSKHDLVFTHFGITCYEALALGLPVIVFNPTRYHSRLSKMAGFPVMGSGRPKAGPLLKLLADKLIFNRLLGTGAGRTREARVPLIQYLRRMEFRGAAACPLCGRGLNKALARFMDRSYFRCPACGMVYLLSCAAEQKSYNKHYFFRHYKQQYGRTYLEDFSFIQRLAEERLDNLLPFLGPGGRKRLLDVGCAYGPFLKAAQARGFAARGIDISPDAVRYVREQLRLPCRRMDFARLPAAFTAGNRQGFDVLCMWFVLEHFQELSLILASVNSLLKKGGVFAFSTPSRKGISARKNLRLFLQQSPADHFTVWNPYRAKDQLRRFGFRVKRVRITGHHAERFFPGRGILSRAFSPLAPFFRVLSRLLGLGDTFEIYAVKERECE